MIWLPIRCYAEFLNMISYDSEEKTMAKKIIGIILVIAALGTALLGIKAGGAAPENKKIIENATVVSDGKVLPENEGKVVIVTGTLEAPLPFVDEETAVVIDSIVAWRYVEKARVVLGSDDEADTWTWDSTISKNDFGGSGKLIAPGVTLGEFAVADELMQPVPTLKQREEYSAADKAAGGWHEFRDKGATYLYQLDFMPYEDDTVNRDSVLKEYLTSKQKNEGTLRVRYNVMEDGASLDYTIIGLQKNGKLVEVEELDLIATVSGHLTVEELLAYADSSASTAKTTAFIIAAVLAGLGVLIIVRSGKAAAPASKKKSKKRT